MSQLQLFIPLSELPTVGALPQVAREAALRQAGLPADRVAACRIVRQSLDARKGFPLGFRLEVELLRTGEEPPPEPTLPPPPRAQAGLRVVVVGSGPAGTFAAARLSQAGAQVTLLEQGKPVQPRRRDLALLTRGELVEHSNYCFGEGGAGTFSDGKLYTRVKDRQAVAEVLRVLVELGADPQIAVEARPHIGSNRLPELLVALRERLAAGGVEYLFEESVTQLLLGPGRRVRGVRCRSGREISADAVLLAVGHSARGLYEALWRHEVALEARPFAVGARVEHPQPLIDRLQYGAAHAHPALPPAFYHLTATCQDRGVYSFCMCPGGWIVPSATEPGGVCVNGMSLKRRDSPFANSALVVTVTPADFAALGPVPEGPLAGVGFQRRIEQLAFAAGGGGFRAPAQRLTDVVAGRRGDAALKTSYRPGVVAADLSQILPPFVMGPLREAVRSFQRRMPGFLSSDAQLVGVETRTSAPLRILRNQALCSPSHAGLYPCGEGAGYAGGIVSAAIDGLRVADAILLACAPAGR